MVTKSEKTTAKKPARFVFYVNVEIARSGFFKPDEEVLVVPSNGTHLEMLWEDR
jgi:hypothetical protein